jgi:solute carrier family 25 folate transporter 32
MGWAPDAAERRRSRWLTPATLALHTQSMIAGAGGGFVSSIATCPLDVIKTKLQAQAAAHRSATYRGVVDTIRHVWTTSGVKGFYRGLGPTILGYLPTWAIYFAVYDSIKQSFGELPLGAPARQQAQHNEREPKDGRNSRIYPAAQVHFYQPSIREHPWTLHILSAMCAGACSTIATNPLWVVKTRFMVRGHRI